jgi:hypothetical protein
LIPKGPPPPKQNQDAAAALRASLFNDSDDDEEATKAKGDANGQSSAVDTAAATLAETPEMSAVPACFRFVTADRLRIAVLGTGSAEPSKVRVVSR